jgi:hypothetical protein
VLVGEEAGERLRQQAEFGVQPRTANCASRWGRVPGHLRGQHGPARDPKLSEATTEGLLWASSSSLLDPLLLGGPGRDQIGPVAGHLPQLADWSWRHEPGRSSCRPASLHGHTASRVSVWAARQMLNVAGIDQPGLEPWASSRSKLPPRSRWWLP